MIDVRAIVDAIAYPAAATGILIESAGIPFPGVAVLLALAAFAAAGNLDLRLVMICGAIGATVGADLGYLVGYRGGRPFVERFGQVFRVNPSHIARSEMFFARHGDGAVLLARFVPGARAWSSVLAGMARMPFWRFQLLNLAGAVIWATAVGATGYLLGSNWPLIERVIRHVGYGWLGLLASGIFIYVLGRRLAEQT